MSLKQSRWWLRGCCFVLLLALLAPAWAQDTPQNQTPQNPPSNNPTQTVPEAGGPNSGPTIAVPKKKTSDAPPPEEKPKPPKKIEGMPDVVVRKEVPLVTVDVTVTTKDGMFIPNLQKQNFRVSEDGVPQTISSFERTEAPVTAVFLVEWAKTNYYFLYDAYNTMYSFLQVMKPDDWIAVVSYDLKPHIWVDFTQDKKAVVQAMRDVTANQIMFSETDLFDALFDTLDRIDGVEGHKYIILVGTGVDTFSRHTLDQALKKVKSTPDVTIFTISTGGMVREQADARGMMSGPQRLDFLQADNQMETFARMTGGMHFKPIFQGQLPEVFRDIGATIRNQYTITYHPSNTKLDGSYRKLKVELVDQAGLPLQIAINGKKTKYNIIAREGYYAKHEVE